MRRLRNHLGRFDNQLPRHRTSRPKLRHVDVPHSEYQIQVVSPQLSWESHLSFAHAKVIEETLLPRIELVHATRLEQGRLTGADRIGHRIFWVRKRRGHMTHHRRFKPTLETLIASVPIRLSCLLSDQCVALRSAKELLDTLCKNMGGMLQRIPKSPRLSARASSVRGRRDC